MTSGEMSKLQWRMATFQLWRRKHPLRWAFIEVAIIAVIGAIVVRCVP
jgi:hypothetical protein